MERRAARELALHPDGAAVQLDQLLHQRQPDAGALEGAAGLALDAMKALEHPIELVRRNADAGIPDRELDGAVAGRCELDPDLSARR